MKGFFALLIGLAGLTLAASVAAAGMSGRQVPRSVYTVAQLQADLAHDTRAWANRRVLVRAIAGGCIPWAAPKGAPCIDEQPELLQMDAAGIVAALPLICGPLPPLLGFVRYLPWLGRLLPAAQILWPGRLSVYRIQLPAIAGYEARLLDSTPSCGDE